MSACPPACGTSTVNPLSRLPTTENIIPICRTFTFNNQDKISETIKKSSGWLWITVSEVTVTGVWYVKVGLCYAGDLIASGGQPVK